MNDPRRLRLLASVGVFLAAFVVYLLTLAPSVDFIDAGELATVAHTWGIAHPTGYPLFTLLAGLWALLPIGSGIFRLNVFAAFLSAGGAAVAVQFFYELLRVPSHRRSPKAQGKKKPATSAVLPAGPGDDLDALQAATAGALLLAFSGTFWRTALSIEVYALHILMLALVLWSAARLFFLPATDAGTLRRRMMITALLLGLSFTNHMSTIFLMPAMLVLLLMTHRRSDGFWKNVAYAAAAFAAGLLPYLYLPLRASAHPYLNWGNPVTFEKFFWHLSGKQYSVWMFSSADAWGKQFAYAFEAFSRDLVWLALLPVVAGIIAAFRRSRQLGTFLLLLFLTCLVWAAGYEILDIDSYFLLAFFMLAGWAAFGLQYAAGAKFLRGQRLLRDPLLIGAIVLIPLLLQWGRVSQSDNYLVEDYTQNMYRSLSPDALVISFQWDFWVSASYYYQRVEGQRRDVTVLDKELFRRSWYLEQLRNNYPDIYEASRSEIEAFLPYLDRFEHGQPYDPAAIESTYNGMVNSIIDHAYGKRPVYVTIEMEKQFAPGYVRVPEGLAFRLYRAEDLPDPAATKTVEMKYRPFASDERLPVEMRKLYASMLLNRGVYLYNGGLFPQADPVFRQALEFAPGDAGLNEWLRKNRIGMTNS
ncbi:MAG: DUF2723 domain-containing protein [Bacteroidetes bacterium]|nr:DUF2723 domain-containing protein [Bacteroidota bacterium]